jgi:glutamate-ammonia-ligase adenylyltransferase
MALTRARVVTASPGFAARVEAVVRDTLCRKRDPASIAADVTEMRRAIAQEKGEGERWNLKYAAGGLVDIEFIAQYLELREAARHPEVLQQNTAAALAALARIGALDPAAAAELLAALRLWRNVQGLIKLTVAEPFDEAAASPALKLLLARGAGAIDFDRLTSDMESAAAAAFGHYRAIVEATHDLSEEEQAP